MFSSMSGMFGGKKAPAPTEAELIAKNEAPVIVADEKKAVLYKNWNEWRMEFEPTPEENLAKAQAAAKDPSLTTMQKYSADAKVSKMKASMKINAAADRQKKKMATSALKSALSSVESAVVSNLTSKIIVALYEFFAGTRKGLRGRIDDIKKRDLANLSLASSAADQVGINSTGAVALSEEAVQRKYEALLLMEEPIGNLLNILGAIPCTYRFEKDKMPKKGLSEMQYIRRGVCLRFCKALSTLHESVADNKAAQNKIAEMKAQVADIRNKVQSASENMDAKEAEAIERLELFLARLDDAGGDTILSPDNPEGMKFASREVMFDTTANLGELAVGDLCKKKNDLLDMFRKGLGSVGKDAKQGDALANQFLEMFEVNQNLDAVLGEVQDKLKFTLNSLNEALAPSLKKAKNSAQQKVQQAKAAREKKKAAESGANALVQEHTAKLRADADAFRKKVNAIADPEKKIQACADFFVTVVEGSYDLLQKALTASVHVIVMMVQGMALAETADVTIYQE